MMQEEHDLPNRILRALRFRPKGMTITEVAKQLGVTRNSVSKHLEILQIAGKVDVRQIGNAKLFSLAQRVPISAFLCFTKNLILILDNEQRIVQVNDQCQRALKRSKDDLIGLTLAEAALPVVSSPEAIAVIEGLEREQVMTDLLYRRDEGGDLFYQMQAIPTTFEDGEKGCTLVLEDITERKRYVRNMEFLARTAMELVDMPPEADIYRYIAEKIEEVVPNPRCYVLSYDEIKQQFFIHAVVPRSFRDGITEIFGKSIVGMTFPVREFFYAAPFSETPSTFFAMRDMHFRPYFKDEELSFYDVCSHMFPFEIGERIKQRFEIARIYLTGLVWQEQLFGLVGICMGPEGLEDRTAIESFLRQASIALARRQTEERLRRSESRFRDLIDSSPIPSAVIESAGRYTYTNRAFTDLFGYTLEDIPTGKDWFRLAFPDPVRRREALAAWKADREAAGPCHSRQRTFPVRCRGGAEKMILFRPVELSDGTEYVTYEDVTEERRIHSVLIGEIAGLRKK